MASRGNVSIIIPTAHRPEALAECLESIQRYAAGGEIIVIGEKGDERTRRLMESFSSVRYLEVEESSTVVARNVGIGKASHEILVFVDDDVVVGSGWLENLLRHYNDDSVAGVGGRVKSVGLESEMSSYRTGAIEDGFVIGNWNTEAAQAFEVQHLPGCNMSFRRVLVLRVGGFDDFFTPFNFREETDLCLRVRRLGYRLIFEPKASLIHKALGRRGVGSRWIFSYVRNTLYLYLKYELKDGASMVRFFRRLIFPPKDYTVSTVVRVTITPVSSIVATSGIIAGILGYLGRRGDGHPKVS